MTNKERKIQELINLAQNDKPLAPPCCEEDILDLFNSYFHLWLPQCSNSDTFVDDIIKKYPSHCKTDIVRLKEYLSAANKYLMDICCTFAGIYQKYGGMSRKDYGTDQKYCGSDNRLVPNPAPLLQCGQRFPHGNTPYFRTRKQAPVWYLS